MCCSLLTVLVVLSWTCFRFVNVWFCTEEPKTGYFTSDAAYECWIQGKNNFLDPAGHGLPMHPGTELAFTAARGHTADSYSVCPLLAPGALIYYFLGAGLQKFFPSGDHSIQSRSNWMGTLSCVSGCPAPILPPSFSLVPSANLMRVNSVPSPRWVRQKTVWSPVPTPEVLCLQLATS